jgi:2-succinyl-5-enolpyruvyl-6-hydroxy-3-cyclohexene-1-carboxylate synthase
MNNQGGGIFKLIDGPGNLTKAELAEYFLTPHSLTAKNIAADHNCAYFNCYNAEGLQQHIPEFFAPRQQAAILEIETDSDINAEVFRKFKSRLAELG